MQDEASAGSISDTATFVVDEIVSELSHRPCDGAWSLRSRTLIRRIEASDLTCPIGIRLIGGLGNQADEFGIVDENSVSLGEMLDGGVDVAHGGDVEVGDVHADLGAAVGEDTKGFDPVEATVGGADVAGDGAGGGDVGLAYEMRRCRR